MAKFSMRNIREPIDLGMMIMGPAFDGSRPAARTGEGFIFKEPTANIVFEGDHIKYDRNGLPISGFIETFSIQFLNASITLEDFRVTLKSILKTSETESFRDDSALLRDILGGSDSVTGGGFSDRLVTYGGRDIIDGRGGIDLIDGGAGADVIRGGKNGDKIFGGGGADRFVFDTEDSFANRPDVIFDFSVDDGDVLSLKSLGKDLEFDGDVALSGKAGQVVFEVNGNSTFVLVDTNGDTSPDMVIKLRGLIDLTEDQFIL